MSFLSSLLKAIDTSAQYNKTTELTPIFSLKDRVMSHPLKKDPSDAVENRRAVIQSSKCIKIQ